MLTEEEFTNLVLARAKKLIRKEQQIYYTKTRINKMVCYVADLMNFDLTKGWYKHGYYSNPVDVCVNSYPRFEELDIETDVFKEIQTKIDDTFVYKLDAHIRNRIRDNFVKERSAFYSWIYSDLVPSDYRNLYRYNVEFTKSLEYLSNDLKDSKTSSEPELREDLNRVQNALSNLRSTLAYIKDDEILDIYLRFSDLLRLLMIRPKKYEVKEEIGLIFENLLLLYLNSQDTGEEIPKSMESPTFSSSSDIFQFLLYKRPLIDGDIWTILTPYRETLTGRRKDEEIYRHTKKIQILKPKLFAAIDALKDFCNANELLPSVQDIKDEIKRIDTKGRVPLREVFYIR